MPKPAQVTEAVTAVMTRKRQSENASIFTMSRYRVFSPSWRRLPPRLTGCQNLHRSQRQSLRLLSEGQGLVGCMCQWSLPCSLFSGVSHVDRDILSKFFKSL